MQKRGENSWMEKWSVEEKMSHGRGERERNECRKVERERRASVWKMQGGGAHKIEFTFGN